MSAVTPEQLQALQRVLDGGGEALCLAAERAAVQFGIANEAFAIDLSVPPGRVLGPDDAAFRSREGRAPWAGRLDMSAETWEAIQSGELHPTLAAFQGKIATTGEVSRGATGVLMAVLLRRPVPLSAALPGRQPRLLGFGKLRADFDKVDAEHPPPSQPVLFVGSSIFNQWTEVPAHMAPLPAINRAFGGSRTWEVLHYIEDAVLRYRPRLVVYYCGSNDVNAGAPGTHRHTSSLLLRCREIHRSEAQAAQGSTRLLGPQPPRLR